MNVRENLENLTLRGFIERKIRGTSEPASLLQVPAYSSGNSSETATDSWLQLVDQPIDPGGYKEQADSAKTEVLIPSGQKPRCRILVSH